MQKRSGIDVHSLIIQSTGKMCRRFKKEQKSQKALLTVRSIYVRKLQLHRTFVRVRSITAPNLQQKKLYQNWY